MSTNPVRIFKYVPNGNQALIARNEDCPQMRGAFFYDEVRDPNNTSEQQRVGIFESPWRQDIANLKSVAVVSGGSFGDIVFRTFENGDTRLRDVLASVRRPDYYKSWWWNCQAGNTNPIGVVAPTISGTPTADIDDITSWTKYTSDGITSAAGLISGLNLLRRAHSPLLVATVKTPSDMTNLMLWIGFVSAAPVDDTGPLHHVAFRFSTGAGDQGWVLSTRGGAAQTLSSRTTFGAPGIVGRVRTIQPDTKYTIYLKIDHAAGKVIGMIDGGCEDFNNDIPAWVFFTDLTIETTATLPATSQNMGAVAHAVSTDPLLNPKSISISRLYVQHK